MRTWSWALLAFAAVGVSLILIGHRRNEAVGHAKVAERGEAAPQAAPQVARRHRDSTGVPPAASSWDDVLGPSAAPDPASARAIAEIVAAHHLAAKQAAMLGLFPPTDMGRTLAELATLVPWGMSDHRPKEASASLALIAKLGARPYDAVATLRWTLGRFPDGYAAERQLLVQTVARLPGDPEAPLLDPVARVEMLNEEMRRPAAAHGGSGPESLAFFNAAVALDTLAQLEESRDPDAFEASVRNAIAAQRDPDAKRLLFSRYQNRAGQRADALARELGL